MLCGNKNHAGNFRLSGKLYRIIFNVDEKLLHVGWQAFPFHGKKSDPSGFILKMLE